MSFFPPPNVTIENCSACKGRHMELFVYTSLMRDGTKSYWTRCPVNHKMITIKEDK